MISAALSFWPKNVSSDKRKPQWYGAETHSRNHMFFGAQAFGNHHLNRCISEANKCTQHCDQFGNHIIIIRFTVWDI